MDEHTRVVLASLLHDLGKFWQRTGQRHAPSFDRVSEADYGRHGAHAKWSADFIERFLPPDWRPAAELALFHHQPRDHASKLVAVADWLSAGERDDLDVHAGAQASQLLSLFSHIRLDEAAASPGDRYFGLEPLALRERAIFPRPDLLSEDERHAAYTRLWDAFLAELAHLPSDDFDAFFESLYFLLQKYTWCVPSAFYRAVPDVSLFDHARTTAAIAAALSRAQISEPQLDALLLQDPGAWQAPRLTLLGGDVTGVQAFLYTITARGAARGLRGRSFYLQLLCEAIARWLLRELELPLANLLYVGGGRFYLLAQLLDDRRVACLRQELDRRLLRCHGGDLYLALGAVALSADHLQLGRRDFGEVWSAIGAEMNEHKRRKFAALAPEELHQAVFAPRGAGGDPGCIVCGGEGPYDRDAPREERKCALCLSLEQLGADLRDADYLHLGRVEPSPPSGPARGYEDALRAFGIAPRLLRDAAALRHAEGALGPGTLFTLTSTDFLADAALAACRSARPGLALGFSLLANVTPRKDGKIAEFADLARASRGVARLAVLRMDVDDLGAIFGRGLGGAATLSHVASLSFLLRVYFEGWLAELARRHNPGADDQDHVYVIYSGGDDLFVVGSWDQVAALAQEVQADFRRFVGDNPALHLSAGLVLEDASFPLYQAADHAGEALARAKAREQGGKVVKDAVDFLGQTASWPDLVLAAQRRDELLELVGAGGVSRALIHTLARIALLATSPSRERRGRRPAPVTPEQVPYGRWMWLMAYSLGRLADRAKEPWRSAIRALPGALLQPAGIRTLGLAARWAELLLRKEET